MSGSFLSCAVATSGVALFSVALFGQCPTPGTYPVEIWRMRSDRTIPERVVIDAPNCDPATGLAIFPSVFVSVTPGLSEDDDDPQPWDPAGAERNAAYAPKITIRSDTDIDTLGLSEPTAPYWKTWWVFRPDGKDVASIKFDGDPSTGVLGNRGREYRLTIGKIAVSGGVVIGASWPSEPQFDAEASAFESTDLGLRHLGRLTTNTLERVNQFVDGRSMPIDANGSFVERPSPGADPYSWYKCRVRVGITGDFGRYTGNDIVRLEARRLLTRSTHYMGSRPNQTLPAGVGPSTSLYRGDYLNLIDVGGPSAPAIDVSTLNVSGVIGIISVRQAGDLGLPYGAERRSLYTGIGRADDGVYFEDWFTQFDGNGLPIPLQGPERNNFAADFLLEINQTGLRFPTKGSAAERANRLQSEAARKYEIRQVTTAITDEPENEPPFTRTSGNIEAKNGIQSAHGSIGRVETQERLVALLRARGSIDYVIGRGAIGAWGSGDTQGAIAKAAKIESNYGGMELRSGVYDGPSAGRDRVRGADMFVDANYNLAIDSTTDDFFGADRFDGVTGLPKRADGTVTRVVATRRNGVGGNMGYHAAVAGDGTTSTVGTAQVLLRAIVQDPFRGPNEPEGPYDRIYIENDLVGSANIAFTSIGAPSGVFSDRTVFVGRNYAGFVGQNTAGVSTLAGQIIANQKNAGGFWTRSPLTDFPAFGTMNFGAAGEGDGPAYANPSSTYGNGALGVAPFRLHREDGFPAQSEPPQVSNLLTTNALGFTGSPFGVAPGTRPAGTMLTPFFFIDESLPATPSTSTWAVLGRSRTAMSQASPTGAIEGRVRLRFYGPIEVGETNPGSLPYSIVAVEHSDVEDFSGTITDVTERFTAWIGGPVMPSSGLVQPVHPTQDASLLRDVIVKAVCGPLKPGYYRVVRWEDRASNAGGADARRGLRCRYVDPDAGQSKPPAVYPFALYFKLGRQFLADIAGPNQSTQPDGDLTADDIIVFLAWYFANDMRADIAGANQSTIPDGNLSADDIIVFFGRFFGSTPESGEALDPCIQPIIEEEEGGGESMRAGSPMAAPASAADGERAQRIAAMQAMIAAETDPQRRAMLQAALSLLQSAPAPQPVGDDR